MLTDEERKRLQEGWFMASDGWRTPIVKIAKQASEKVAAEEEAQ